MSDEADNANDHLERITQAALNAIRSATLEAEATGVCLNCGETVPEQVRFCDTFCMADWQKRKKRL